MENNLRTTDWKSKDTELLTTFQHPIITHEWAQFSTWHDNSQIHILLMYLNDKLIVVLANSRVTAMAIYLIRLRIMLLFGSFGIPCGGLFCIFPYTYAVGIAIAQTTHSPRMSEISLVLVDICRCLFV